MKNIIIRTNLVIDYKELQKRVHPTDKEIAPTIRNKLIKEYNANSSTEFMIIDLMTTAYCRSITVNQVLNYYLFDNDGHFLGTRTQERVSVIKELTKQSELANRQFFSALTFLKELKRPPVNIKINTKAAFVGQNQQFNKNA